MPPPPLPPLPRLWHIVCQVVDNFGDAGVLWRLARQLCDEYGCQIHFFIDEPDTLRRLAPQARLGEPLPAVSRKGCGPAGPAEPAITVHRLTHSAPIGLGADVVLLGFQARLPDTPRRWLLRGPSSQRRQPLVIQLEYLSAESWVEDCHGLPSLHPDGLCEYFFHPGFSPRTGGLLMEASLPARRDVFMANPANRRDWLSARGVEVQADEQLASVLCYPHAPLLALAGQWACFQAPGQRRRLHLLAAGADSQAHLPDASALAAASGGLVRISRLPFLPQADFDQLLWSCDLNLVRGEDSWIRALWTGRPWLWQAYPQSGAAHLAKVEAFLQYAESLLLNPGMPCPSPEMSAFSMRAPLTISASASRKAAEPPHHAVRRKALQHWRAAMQYWNGAPGARPCSLQRWLAAPEPAAVLALNLRGLLAGCGADLAARLSTFVRHHRLAQQRPQRC